MSDYSSPNMDFASSTRFTIFPNRLYGIFPYFVTGPSWAPILHINRFSNYLGNILLLFYFFNVLFYLRLLSISTLENFVEFLTFLNITFCVFNIIFTSRKNAKQLQAIHLFFCKFSSNRMFSACQRRVTLFCQFNLTLFLIVYITLSSLLSYNLNFPSIFTYLYFHIAYTFYNLFLLLFFTYLFTLNSLLVVLNQNTKVLASEIIQMHVQLRSQQCKINDIFGMYLLNLVLGLLIYYVSACFSIYNFKSHNQLDYIKNGISIFNLTLVTSYLAYFTSSIINEVSNRYIK